MLLMSSRLQPTSPRLILWLTSALAIGLAGAASPVAAQGPEGEQGTTTTESADDVTTNALTRSLPTSIVELVRALRWWVVPFAVATLVALWFTTERLVVLRRGRVIPKPFVQRFLKLLDEGELSKDEALEICLKNDSPVAHVFAHGVRKWDKPSVEVEQAIIDGGERQVSALRSHLRVINGVATITPMIGLLGTVVGMLESFHNIAAAGAMGKTSQLASGIALALVTTAAGLGIAIPALISYMYLSGRVDALVMEMDQLAQNVVTSVSSEALADRTARPRKTAGSTRSGPGRRSASSLNRHPRRWSRTTGNSTSPVLCSSRPPVRVDGAKGDRASFADTSRRQRHQRPIRADSCSPSTKRRFPPGSTPVFSQRRMDPSGRPRMGFSLGNAFAGSLVTRYLGIDPGLNCTGYALLERSATGPKLLEGGVLSSTASKSLAERVHEIGDGLRDVVREFRPQAMAIEQVFSHAGHPKTAVLMAHARGAILFAASDVGVPIVHYTPRQIKKLLTGSGKADKEQVQLAIQRELGLEKVLEPNDVADAFAIALCHYHSTRLEEGQLSQVG